MLHKFNAWIDEDKDAVMVDADEVAAWADGATRSLFDRDAYLGRLRRTRHGTIGGALQQCA